MSSAARAKISCCVGFSIAVPASQQPKDCQSCTCLPGLPADPLTSIASFELAPRHFAAFAMAGKQQVPGDDYDELDLCNSHLPTLEDVELPASLKVRAI